MYIRDNSIFINLLVCFKNFSKFLNMNYTRVYNVFSFNAVNSNSKANSLVSDSFGNRCLGFKIQIRGRFSRKQRAANIVVQYGSMPLNKFISNIDYSMSTITIVNSKICVKFWSYFGDIVNQFNWLLKLA